MTIFILVVADSEVVVFAVAKNKQRVLGKSEKFSFSVILYSSSLPGEVYAYRCSLWDGKTPHLETARHGQVGQ